MISLILALLEWVGNAYIFLTVAGLGGLAIWIVASICAIIF